MSGLRNRTGAGRLSTRIGQFHHTWIREAVLAKRGFIFELAGELAHGGTAHRDLVARIERQTQRNLICYVAHPTHPDGALHEGDPDLLENVLRSVKLETYDRRLDLLVSSPGGAPQIAGRIVRVCRTFASEFRAVVATRADSAAALICLGADELVMAETASLGFLDPRVVMETRQGRRLVNARVLIDAQAQLMLDAQNAVESDRPAQPFLHAIESLDVAAVEECRQAFDAARQIGSGLLAAGLLRGARERIEHALERMLSNGEAPGATDLYAEALTQHVGLPVTLQPVGSDLDKFFRELIVRLEALAGQRDLARLICSRDGMIDVPAVLPPAPPAA